MHAPGKSCNVQLPVEAACAGLMQLFLLVDRLVARHKGVRQLQLRFCSLRGWEHTGKVDDHHSDFIRSQKELLDRATADIDSLKVSVGRTVIALYYHSL